MNILLETRCLLWASKRSSNWPTDTLSWEFKFQLKAEQTSLLQDSTLSSGSSFPTSCSSLGLLPTNHPLSWLGSLHLKADPQAQENKTVCSQSENYYGGQLRSGTNSNSNPTTAVNGGTMPAIILEVHTTRKSSWKVGLKNNCGTHRFSLHSLVAWLLGASSKRMKNA